ncbi:adenylate/guanylate cyclase domain-containing protein [Ruegeria sp. 2205SS24-7]|uniref:CHASE2 domain-containing protein n=1 Tax=Ruegeria discodermiae TaxID=3064389 RepID=UPI002740E6E8|nr:adenylate/guanylate cyclase domain-containing protein [Ruegeria sp. 2205SS24-7]MDP5217270.1 adenylate/guanylate cyclase domain-containing protein [Ruegeria sp. 2205SS24-7]
MVAPDGFRREWRITGAIVLLLSLLIAIWHPGDRSPFWQGVEGRLLDARFLWRGPMVPPAGIAIIAFDDAAMSQLETFPPPRSALAEAVSVATEAGAAAIALDFLLIGPRAGDRDLAGALAEINAVLGVAEAPADAELQDLESGGFSVVIAPEIDYPLPALGPVETLSDMAAIGHVNLSHDSDGAARRLGAAQYLATQDGNKWYPSLALAALKASDAELDLQVRSSQTGGRLSVGETQIALDGQGAIPLNFYGQAGTIPTYSFAELADADLRGKIIFVGATATGFGDRHATSYDATFPGVELHATLAANVIEQRFLRRDALTWSWDIALALIAATLGFFAARLDRPLLGALATAGVFIALAIVVQTAFGAGWWLDGVTALFSLLLGAGVGAGLRLVQHRRRAANLALYQSPLLVERLADAVDPRFEASARPAVVLFVDVANFTKHSERLGPEGTADFLRLFHGLVEQSLEPQRGIIAHFAGDGAMVVFGLPEPNPDDAIRALRFIEALYAVVGACSDWPGLGLRVGGQAGPVKTSIIGGKRHKQLAVSGDVVNTASRLQDFAKSQSAAIALSSALLQSNPETREHAEKMGLRPAGQHTLRGRAEPIEIWTGPPPTSVEP